MNTIGIRHEDKYKFERRTPIIPNHVKELTENEGISFSVESSDKRIFSDQEYRDAGAAITDDLSDCDVIFGVKEMPENYFEEGKAYIFFSHVIKGQPYNMPMLKELVKKRATLIDYEKIEDDDGRRLIFFGRFAGLAGMINTLWAAGQRFLAQGIEAPLSSIKQTYQYSSLDEAKSHIQGAGRQIAEDGLPDSIKPLIIAVTGDGNVSQGALEILDQIPGDFISAEDLKNGNFDSDQNIIKVNLLVNDYMIPAGNQKFELNHFIKNPELYTSAIEDYLPEINIFVNGIYWDEKYPRLITKTWIGKMVKSGRLKLHTIGDISCDIHGSVECTEIATTIEDPVFIYDPLADSFEMGFEGDGVAVMAVDILPSELPREASAHFSESLMPFMKHIAKTDFSASFKELNLPEAIKKAVIAHDGSLTPNYRYLESSLKTV